MLRPLQKKFFDELLETVQTSYSKYSENDGRRGSFDIFKIF